MADDRMNWKTPVFFVLAVLLVCLASYIAGRVKGREMGRQQGYSEGFEAGWSAPHPADTVFRVDTVFHDRPVPVSSIPAGVELLPVGTLAQMQARIDSLLAVQPDTAFVEIPVPIEVRQYADSTYRAQVSGWHPSLDWIEIYQKTQTITERIPDTRRWTWGVSAGPGVFIAPDGKVRPGAGAVFGLQYRF